MQQLRVPMPESTFHEAIRAGDVAARLIYADWLEEQGRLVECSMLRSGRWCLIPAGSFWMGGGGGKSGKKRVKMAKAFYLGAYAVTQREWQEVMGNNPSYFSRNGEGRDRVTTISDGDLAEFPVENVSWNETQEYIRTRNEQEESTGWVYRLPSDAEWEYACRGAPFLSGESTFHYYLDQPSNDLSSMQANFNGNYPDVQGNEGPYLGRPNCVGSHPPNCLGLFDMHGNVWEWCQDFHRKGGFVRVLRGGSWNCAADYCRSSNRGGSIPTDHNNNFGFRLARVPAE